MFPGHFHLHVKYCNNTDLARLNFVSSMDNDLYRRLLPGHNYHVESQAGQTPSSAIFLCGKVMAITFLALRTGLSLQLFQIPRSGRITIFTLSDCTSQVWIFKEWLIDERCWFAFTAVTVRAHVFSHFTIVTGVLYGTSHGNFSVNSLFGC